ncbi:serine/threonine-protein kinase [Staphylococcus haemolyticus]|uniref:serine/threonine-protein kinase n=1 Tax=Staphylococcus haemolyticus TaxID=1283 RepID=UPI000E76A424|nr:serine/threonine-protein kinase [Staphylococcus haemolyticus]RJG34398.1 serine/threonine protein kinase [Staphylococcus haemolyticus]
MIQNINLIKGSLLGEGGTASIYNCTLEINGKAYEGELVMKVLKDSYISILPHRFDREMRYMDQLSHKNIVKPVYVDYDEGIIVMKKFKCNLKEFIENNNVSDELKQNIIMKILGAISHYISEGIIHRDLKPENILMDDQNEPYISDFGLSSKLKEQKTQFNLTKTGVSGWGTMFYTAPEQFDELKSADEKSEIFSIGRIIYSVFTEDFKGISTLELKKASPNLRYIINKATNSDPLERFNDINDLEKSLENIFRSNVSIKEMEINDILDILKENSKKIEKNKIFTIINDENFTQNDELFTSLNIDEHQILKEINEKEYNLFLNKTARFFKESGFIFSYVDTITDKVILLLQSDIPEIEQKINLIIALINISTRHNRFYAMRECGKFIHEISDEFLLYQLKNVIIKRNLYTECQKIHDYYVINNLLDLLG